MNKTPQCRQYETQEALLEAHRIYEYIEGKLFWKVKTARKVVVGHRAGNMCKTNTYRGVKIFGRLYKEHRVVWAMHYGEWPEQEIDHINHIRDDNRIENLRDVPHRLNQQNLPTRKDNKYEATGVRWRSDRNKWQAYTSAHHSKFKSLGHYETKDEAVKAREIYLMGAI